MARRRLRRKTSRAMVPPGDGAVPRFAARQQTGQVDDPADKSPERPAEEGVGMIAVLVASGRECHVGRATGQRVEQQGTTKQRHDRDFALQDVIRDVAGDKDAPRFTQFRQVSSRAAPGVD